MPIKGDTSMSGAVTSPTLLPPRGRVGPQPTFPPLHRPEIPETPMPLRQRYSPRVPLAAPTATNTTACRYRNDQAVQFRSAVVDNLSDQWLRIDEGGPKYVPPWTWGAVIWLEGRNTLTGDWAAPPGIAQKATPVSYTPDAGYVTASENDWQPNPGVNILSLMQTLYNIT